MEKRSLRLLIIGMLSVMLLCVLYGISGKISPDNTGDMYDYECLVKSCIVILISIITIRILFAAIINPAEIRHQKKMPGILKYIVGTLILTAAAVYIVTAIYSKSAMAIFTTLGASGIGIAFIAQDTLKELIAGIVISYQNDFRVGDWIKLPDGTIAQILRLKLTCIDLALLNDTRLYISNTKLTNASIINLSQPAPSHFSRIDVILEHNVPVEQARRILYTATANTPGLASKEPLVVADAVLQNGILFAIFFKIPSFDVGAEMKHRVISCIVQHLHRHGLKICEISGQININNIDTKQPIRKFNDENATDAITALKYSELLKNCTSEIQKSFAKGMEKLFIRAGEVIFKQGDVGDTMFIIAEGVVNVSLDVSVTENGKTKTSTKVVATLSDGDYFGEMALLRGENRSATITAKSDVVLYKIKRETIKKFMNSYEDFAQKLSKAIIERSTETEGKKTEFINQLNKKEDPISEFMNTFKSFLGR